MKLFGPPPPVKGDTVQLICGTPSSGLGRASVGDFGIVTWIDGTDLRIDFPRHTGWMGKASEVSVIPEGTIFKHIRYKATLVKPACKVVKVVILEQTHRNGAFGSKASSRFDHEGFSLRSSACPDGAGNTCAYLLGSDKSCDDYPIVMSAETYPAFKKAVSAYNAHFSGNKEEAGPQQEKSADGMDGTDQELTLTSKIWEKLAKVRGC